MLIVPTWGWAGGWSSAVVVGFCNTGMFGLLYTLPLIVFATHSRLSVSSFVFKWLVVGRSITPSFGWLLPPQEEFGEMADAVGGRKTNNLRTAL